MFFCSRECFGNHQLNKIEVECLNCFVAFLKLPNQVKKNPNNFCSKSCAVSYNNRNRPKKVKIKLVKEKLKTTYNCDCCRLILKSKTKYCDTCRASATLLSSKKASDRKYTEYIAEWQGERINGDRGGEGTVSYHIRRYLFDKYNSQCSECGWNKINQTTGKIPLEIDHIDGNWGNNREENLRLICPNCHSLTPTYRGLNKGKGRTIRLAKLRK